MFDDSRPLHAQKGARIEGDFLVDALECVDGGKKRRAAARRRTPLTAEEIAEYVGLCEVVGVGGAGHWWGWAGPSGASSARTLRRTCRATLRTRSSGAQLVHLSPVRQELHNQVLTAQTSTNPHRHEGRFSLCSICRQGILPQGQVQGTHQEAPWGWMERRRRGAGGVGVAVGGGSRHPQCSRELKLLLHRR